MENELTHEKRGGRKKNYCCSNRFFEYRHLTTALVDIIHKELYIVQRIQYTHS